MKFFSVAILFLFFYQSIFAQAVEMVTVTLIRKKVQVTVGEETKTPLIGDQLPMNAIVQSEGMGYLEFKYKGSSYRVGKNTTIVISEIINSTAESGMTNSGGVRAKVDDPDSKPNFGKGKAVPKKKKPKEKKVEEK
jgi:hypothetical protein